MGRKILVYLVFFLFLLTLLFSGYLFFRLKEKKPIVTTTDQISVDERKIAVNPQDPIKKGYMEDGKIIVYDIRGYFSENLKKKDPILEGRFIIEGDPLKREITTYIGYLNGKTVFGKYEGSFSGKSTWSMIDTEVVFNTIKPQQPVVIRAVFYVSDDEAERISLKEQEEVLDTLTLEFKGEKKFQYIIPIDFAIVADRIGVVE